MIVSAADTLTHVELIWIEKRIEHWIRFGRDVAEQILDRRRRVFSFAPNSIFAFVRWEANDFGTVASASISCAPFAPAKATRPCRQCSQVVRFFYASPAGRKSSACCNPSTPLSKPASIPPTRARITGRHVHNRLIAGDEPRRLYGRTAPGMVAAAEDCRMTRRAVLMLACAATVAVVLPIWLHPVPRLIWNASASVPIGLYAVQPEGALHLDSLVIVSPPEPLAGFLAERGYLPKGVPLLKHIAALPGQIVCRIDRTITVDGNALGEAFLRDRRGRALRCGTAAAWFNPARFS